MCEVPPLYVRHVSFEHMCDQLPPPSLSTPHNTHLLGHHLKEGLSRVHAVPKTLVRVCVCACVCVCVRVRVRVRVRVCANVCVGGGVRGRVYCMCVYCMCMHAYIAGTYLAFRTARAMRDLPNELCANSRANTHGAVGGAVGATR